VEYHPRLNLDDLLIKESKIILGSFPTWSLSDTVNISGDILLEKLELRKKSGEIPFFFGSAKNQFWHWYKIFNDPHLDISVVDNIVSSLNYNQIGITDVILSCKRRDKSALDKHLTKREYNQKFFNYPKKGKTVKVLCTSKGILNEMLLNKKFFIYHDTLSVNLTLSNLNQRSFITNIKGDIALIKKPFYSFIEVENGGIIECLAIPSPGSPYRKLIDFGLNTLDVDGYLNSFVKQAFDWFRT
jgi:hypothetical protein